MSDFMNLGSTQMPFLHQELVRERIHTLRQEAEQERLASRVRNVQRARRQVERAAQRLRHALDRL